MSTDLHTMLIELNRLPQRCEHSIWVHPDRPELGVARCSKFATRHYLVIPTVDDEDGCTEYLCAEHGDDLEYVADADGLQVYRLDQEEATR